MGELPISSSIVIEGTGTSSNTVVRPNLNGRIFNVSSAGTLDLRDATVRNGVLAADGGGILSAGSLKLRRVAVTNNQAFGTEDGGGIFATGSVVIADSTIAGNRAANGGGITYLGTGGGSLTIARSTLSGNTADPAAGFGGGLLAGPSTQTLVSNSTLSGNTADTGGAISAGANMTLDHATVADNSGAPAGITTSNSVTITLAATILDNPNGDNCSATGTIASGGGNVENGNDCRLGAGDKRNTDPLLGPLAANGGPTRTRAIPANSPARDAVTSGCPPPATDQRGVARPQEAACDSGAFEFAPPSAVLDLSLTAKGKQRAKKLKVEVGCGAVDCSVDLKGRSKVPKRAATSAKASKFKLKPKGVDIAAGATETVRLKFKKNRKTVKKVRALLEQAGKKARKAKVVVSATATAGGDTATAEQKIKLKR